MRLEEILSSLQDIAHKVQTNPAFCREMRRELKGRGYEGFNDLNGIDGDAIKEQVMKALAVAVNEAIHVKVDPSVDYHCLQFLQLINIDDIKSLKRCFKFQRPREQLIEKLKVASSPCDIVKYINESAPQWLIENLIQYQFEIKWNTHNGEPYYFTFYQFCCEERSHRITAHFKYKPRLAHAKTALYHECRKRSVANMRRIIKENLCPTVYIRTANGWASWQADDEDISNDVDIENDLSWINPSIRKFIRENADEQKEIDEGMASCLDKHTLYWAVLDDEEFYPMDERENIYKTQVYVGRANNGIRGRWIKDKDNHCAMMKKCLDNVCAMTTYDHAKLEGVQLVDVRLTLAKVRSYGLEKPIKAALFVIKTFGDDAEKAEIAKEKAQARLNEAQRDLDEAQPDLDIAEKEAHWFELQQQQLYQGQLGYPYTRFPYTRFPSTAKRLPPTSERMNELRVDVEKHKKEFEEMKAVADDLKDIETNKTEAEDQLTQAEKWHRKGKRIHDRRKNVIPYNDYKLTWKPTDMRFGMNFS